MQLDFLIKQLGLLLKYKEDHSSNPLFEKGGCTFGVSKVEGGSRIRKLRGGGLDSHKGNSLSWIWKVPYFKKMPAVSYFNLFFAYMMRQFSRIYHLQQALNQVLVIIVGYNFSNCKKQHIFRWKNLDVPIFALLDHYSWTSGGWSKFSRNSGGTFCHQATTKIQGGLRPSSELWSTWTSELRGRANPP